MGASPVKKNILFEYDWFDDNSEPGTCSAHTHRPTQAMIDRVSAAFAASPLASTTTTPSRLGSLKSLRTSSVGETTVSPSARAKSGESSPPITVR